MFQAYVDASSLLRRYALLLFYSVSLLLCADGCSTVCYELTRNFYAIVSDIAWDTFRDYYKAGVVCDIFWAVVIWIVKTSILAFYWRLFSAGSRSLRVIIWALEVFVTCWALQVVSSRSSNCELVIMGNSESRP